MGRLDAKVAVITGGANGLGRAAALRLAADGAAVLLADVDMDGAEAVANQIHANGGRAATIRCDILEEAEIEAAVAKAVETFGSLDIMFNNAAALPQELLVQDVDILTIRLTGGTG